MKLFLIGVGLCFALNCSANEFRWGLGVGYSNVDLSPATLDKIDGYLEDDDALSAMAYVGYMFDSNLLIDFAYTSSSNDIFFDVFDNFDFNSYDLAIGYRFGERSRYIESKIGVMSWELELSEGLLFNPGKEEQLDTNGTCPFVVLTVGKEFSNRFGMSLSYKYADFDIGIQNSLYLGFNFSI